MDDVIVPTGRLRLEVRSVGKIYGIVPVLSDVSFDVEGGEVLGLIGANGAGKSTLVKCLTGVVEASTGGFFVDGAEVSIRSPQDGLRAGIAAVNQKVELADDQSVAENILLGRFPKKAGLIVTPRMLRRVAAELIQRVGLRVKASTNVGVLTPSDKRLVMIAAVLARNPRVVIFDEPTAALPLEASRVIVDLVKELRRRGTAVIYISHRLREIAEVSDRVLALKGGQISGILEGDAITQPRMLELIGGREESLSAHDSQSREDATSFGEAILEARGLSGHRVKGVTLSVRSGEILGVAGLAGSGRSEILRLLFGLQSRTNGEIFIRGEPIDDSIQRRVKGKIGYLAELRDANVLTGLTVQRNATISAVGSHRRFGLFTSAAWEHEATITVGAQISLKGAPKDLIDTLSGGNQQKVLLSRLIIQDADVFVLDEPTAGVDLVARAEIHRMLRELTARGKAVIVASVETDELTAICDRVIVLVEGQISAELRAPFTEEALVSAAFRHDDVAL